MDAGITPSQFEKQPDIPCRGQRKKGEKGDLVLVVDDALPMRRLVSMVLIKNGYEVVTADGGRGALDILKAQGANIKLLMTDVLMPGMDGFTLIREAKALHPGLKFLAMSGTYTSEEINGELLALGGVDLLLKPFNHFQLLNAVETALSTGEHCSVPPGHGIDSRSSSVPGIEEKTV